MLFVDVRSQVQLVCDTGVSDGRTDGHCDGRMTGSESFQSAVYSRPTGCGVVAQRRFSVVGRPWTGVATVAGSNCLAVRTRSSASRVTVVM